MGGVDAGDETHCLGGLAAVDVCHVLVDEAHVVCGYCNFGLFAAADSLLVGDSLINEGDHVAGFELDLVRAVEVVVAHIHAIYCVRIAGNDSAVISGGTVADEVSSEGGVGVARELACVDPRRACNFDV